ncbi:MAG: glycosyltransferase family 39 protein [Bacteroidia bacterium]
MKRFFQRTSLITLLIVGLLLSVYRISNVDKKEISWDILGYYMCLPATFIHHDPLLKDIIWLKEINQQQELTGTLYQVSTNDTGEPIYVFLFGMALFYLPFFYLGHSIASWGGYEINGFSMPYQYALVIGGIIYTIIGLIYLRKILRYFFSEQIASIVIIIVVFGTNYIHHLTLKNLETVNILFMLVSIVVWNTIKWHEQQKLKNLLAIGVSTTLMFLVKPSEVFIFFIPLLWNVYSFATLQSKASLLLANIKSLLITSVFCVLLIVPQLIYWKITTGHFVYDSYKNPGVGLDFFSPHIIEVLFSYRKGWFLYTPVMLFSIVGFYFLYKNNKPLFWPILLYVSVSFYVISCWTYWYYGAAYSCRPIITSYPLLAICLGYFFVFIQKQKKMTQVLFSIAIVFFIFLNQFQWWQLKNYILDPYRTTREYYWAIFMKTVVPENVEQLLSVNRDFTGTYKFENSEKYNSHILYETTFDNDAAENKAVDTISQNIFYRANEQQEYCITAHYPFKELTSKDHACNPS